MKTNKKGILGLGIFSAIAASLCCITPVLALIAGTSGAASAFSWIEPYRFYFIGFTILVLGFAWYQILKPKTKVEIECTCEDDEKPKFIQTKTFLAIVTLFAASMLAFPYYSSIFYPKNEKQILIVKSENIQKIKLKVEGLTCTACEESINYSVNKLDGILNIESSFEKGTSEIEFDKSKTSLSEIKDAINATGYKVVNNNEE